MGVMEDGDGGQREGGRLKETGGRNRGGTIANSREYGYITEAHTTPSWHCQCTPQSQSTCGSDINHYSNSSYIFLHLYFANVHQHNFPRMAAIEYYHTCIS